MKRTLFIFLGIVLLGWSATDLSASARPKKEKKSPRWLIVDPAAEKAKSENIVSPEESGSSVHTSAIAPTEAAAGEADITYQGYFNRVNSSTVASVGGASFSLKRFYPERGLFSLRLEPVIDQGGLSAGENYAQWSGLPWKGRHWDFSLGDFHVNAAMHPLPFTNLTQPEFYLRGANVTTRTRDWRYSLYSGMETLSQGPRIPFRDVVSQMAIGVEASTTQWERFKLGFRYLHLLSTKSTSGEQNPLVPLSRQFKTGDSFVAQSKIKIAKGLEWYSEAGWSQARTGAIDSNSLTRANLPFSIIGGPSWNTSHFILHANYVRQNESYLPLLGYFLGDREGTNIDAVLQMGRFGLSGSVGKSRNNLANNLTLPSFTSRQASGGLQIRLPLRFTVSGSLSTIGLDSRYVETGFERSSNRQVNFSITNSIFGHSLRASVQQVDLNSRTLVQQLRLSTLEDNFHWKHLSIGAAVRLQHTSGPQLKDSLFYRTTGQFQIRRFSLYAYIEQGKDLANTTLFAKDTVGTSVIGSSWSSPRGFELQVEALRNTSNTILNAANVFILASQGIPLNSTLSRFNNWSLYIRATQHFGWGDKISLDSRGEIHRRAPLTGTLQGIVKLNTLDGEIPARGVWVVLDSGTTVKTDENGYFEVLKVSEGQHDVALNLDRLPAEMNPTEHVQESVVLFPEKASRVEFHVLPLQGFVGTIRDSKGNPAPEGIVVRLTPIDLSTTTDQDGRFGFYNLPEGSYEASVENGSLPEYSRIKGGERFPVSIRYGKKSPEIKFTFETLQPPKKPVQKLELSERKVVKPTPKTSWAKKMIVSSSRRKDEERNVTKPLEHTSAKNIVYARVKLGAIQ